MKFLIVGLLVVSSIPSSADVEIKPTQHPIDAWYEEKMAEETVISTMDMREITNQARGKWEAELNVVYKRLMKRLNPKQQATLRKSQQQWLKYRETEGNALYEIVSSQQGTIHQLQGTNLSMRLVRLRVIDLLGYEQEFDK